MLLPIRHDAAIFVSHPGAEGDSLLRPGGRGHRLGGAAFSEAYDGSRVACLRESGT